MKRELNDIFKINNREGRKKVLNKFELTNEDKQLILNNIDNISSSGNTTGGFTYKPKDVYWEFDIVSFNAATDDTKENCLHMWHTIFTHIPMYSLIYKDEKYYKVDKYGANSYIEYMIGRTMAKDDTSFDISWKPLAFQECVGSSVVINGESTINVDGVINLCKNLYNVTDEELLLQAIKAQFFLIPMTKESYESFSIYSDVTITDN